MFSATWPQIIQKLASEFLSSPVKVAIGSQDLQACKRVKQIVEGSFSPSSCTAHRPSLT
jgi:ATP-dependent RNA helicase DBP3